MTPQHFKEYIRTQIGWGQSLGARYRSEGMVSERDAVKRRLGSGGQKPTATEYMLQQVIFVVPAAERKAKLGARKREAEALRQRFRGCDSTREFAKGLVDVAVRDLGRVLGPDPPPDWENSTKATTTGQATPVRETDKGVEVIGICSARDVSDDRVARMVFSAEGTNDEKADSLTKKYLEDLRGKAKIQEPKRWLFLVLRVQVKARCYKSWELWIVRIAGRFCARGEICLRWTMKKLSLFRNSEMGFVFQFHHLLSEFTALENVMIPCRVGGESVKLAREKALRLLDFMGLADRFDHYPSQLSGGELQRVAIARALVREPKILFADEPTGNLDSNTSLKIQDLFFRLKEEMKLALVVVTHDLAFATRFPKVLRMKDGLWQSF